MVSNNSDVANTTIAYTTVAKSSTVANSTASKYSTGLAAVYCFQVSVGQFNFPNRVLWEKKAFLFAEALTIRFVFPRAYDVDFHLFSFPIYFRTVVN
jgi:hypothetical protein